MSDFIFGIKYTLLIFLFAFPIPIFLLILSIIYGAIIKRYFFKEKFLFTNKMLFFLAYLLALIWFIIDISSEHKSCYLPCGPSVSLAIFLTGGLITYVVFFIGTNIGGSLIRKQKKSRR